MEMDSSKADQEDYVKKDMSGDDWGTIDDYWNWMDTWANGKLGRESNVEHYDFVPNHEEMLQECLNFKDWAWQGETDKRSFLSDKDIIKDGGGYDLNNMKHPSLPNWWKMPHPSPQREKIQQDLDGERKMVGDWPMAALMFGGDPPKELYNEVNDMKHSPSSEEREKERARQLDQQFKKWKEVKNNDPISNPKISAHDTIVQKSPVKEQNFFKGKHGGGDGKVVQADGNEVLSRGDMPWKEYPKKKSAAETIATGQTPEEVIRRFKEQNVMRWDDELSRFVDETDKGGWPRYFANPLDHPKDFPVMCEWLNKNKHQYSSPVISKLGPTGTIIPHRHNLIRRENRILGRMLYNYCLNFPKGCRFAMHPYGLIPYKPGDIYRLWVHEGMHSVINNSTEDRYHVMLRPANYREYVS